MNIPVIIEDMGDGRYRVTGAGGLSVGLIAEGATAAEALDRLADQVRSRLNAGARVVELSVAEGEAPWMQDAGSLRDEPLYDSWREAMVKYRCERDEEPEAL